VGDYLVTVQILLAAYNGAAWLPAQLQSLRDQTDRDFTVLWQDDGSSDDTPTQLSRCSLQDDRFLPGAQQGCHLGAKGNFLSLIRQAKADAVLLCDQDDVWFPEKVARLKKALAKAEVQNGAGTPLLVHSDCRGIDEAGAQLFPSFFRHQGWDPAAVTLPQLLVQNNVTGCTLIMNKALLKLIAAHGDADKIFMHDWFIALTAAAFGRVVFLNDVLTGYRQHLDNAIGASSGDQLARGMEALGRQEKAKARIRLTYTHTRSFRDLYGDLLPENARNLIDAYLATEALPKLPRLWQVRRLGCVMQSPVTRAGQLFFG
jgi:glycosyltransferase involved in cell wall biosynthesis